MKAILIMLVLMASTTAMAHSGGTDAADNEVSKKEHCQSMAPSHNLNLLSDVKISYSDIGVCMGECASEQGICMGQCQGDGMCISHCAEAHGRCVARCSR